MRDAVLPVLREAGMDVAGAVAQDVAEWLDADGHMTPSLATGLARAIRASGVEPRAIPSGCAVELPAGYWLVVAEEDAIGQSQAGTAAIFALVGGAPVTVTPKAAVPVVSKHVLEDSDGAWGKAADATVGDDLYWRLCATIPAGLGGYDAYTVEFADAMSAGLDLSKVASTVRVYVAAGADGGFDAVTVSGGSVSVEPADGWKDITAGCAVSVDAEANAFTVRTGDLVSALGGAEKFAAGARVAVVYNAPLGVDANRGAEQGNPNAVYLRYPRSPFADQGGEGGYTRTPSDNATAYVDSGALTVEEVAAPEGYVGFTGARALTLAVAGLDVEQVAAARPTLTVSAEKPLRVDGADAATGAVEATVLNSAKPTSPGGWISGLLPKTGDRCLAIVVALAVVGAAAAIMLVVGSRFIRRGGDRRDR